MILPKYRKSNSAIVKENSTVSNPPTTMTSSIVVSPPPTSNTPTAPPPNKIIGLIKKKASKPLNMKMSYVQASKANISSNIEDVLHVKKTFPSLLVDEVEKILKAKNSSNGNKKPRINMMTRELSRKEVIIPMTKPNTELIVNLAHIHTSNINKCEKFQIRHHCRFHLYYQQWNCHYNKQTSEQSQFINNQEIFEKYQKCQPKFY